jgi:hypothetical protein
MAADGEVFADLLGGKLVSNLLKYVLICCKISLQSLWSRCSLKRDDRGGAAAKSRGLV